jgi:hypothetical protein
MTTSHRIPVSANLKEQIDQTFSGKAFERPLFYSYEGGLRFELSEGGTAVQMFLQSLTKATTICADIFHADSEVTVCLRTWTPAGRFDLRDTLRAVHQLGIDVAHPRQIWTDPNEDGEGWNVFLAFQSPASQLQSLLWIACASDFGAIAPRPACSVYLFDLAQRIMAFPYDDRGMDVVGPNDELLTELYWKHNALLLDYDRERMRTTFEGGM